MTLSIPAPGQSLEQADDRPVPVRPPRLAFAALVAANILLSFGPMLVRLADVGPTAAGFWRLFLALPLLFLFMRLRRQNVARLTPMLWALIGLGGIFFAADLASWHAGILRTKVANATLFGNLSSLLLPLWGMAVLRQRPSAGQIVALALAAAGTALLVGNSYEASPRYLVGDLLCIVAGILYTGYILALQRARRILGNWAVLAVSSATGALPLLLLALASGEQVMPHDWTPLVILALSSQVIGQGLLIYALVWFTPLIVGLTLLIQPVIGALVGWLLFGETMTPLDGVGAMAIAIALILVGLPRRA